MAKTSSASRFSVLHDAAASDEETELRQSNSGEGANALGKSAAKNAKKRAKKRAARAETSDRLLSANGTSQGRVDTWKDWQTRDKILVEDQFEKDLQEAILQSKLEEEKRRKDEERMAQFEASLLKETEEKKQKKGKVKMSLQEWHSSLDPVEPSHDVAGLDPLPVPPALQEEDKKTLGSESSFFDRVSLEVAAEMDREELSRAVKLSQHSKAEAARLAYEVDSLEKKDKTIQELSVQVQALQSELKEVKLRNKQLCHILSKGEMKEKSELVQQYEEMVQAKDELTTEISELHVSLEQERTKVKTLKSEILKHQRHTSSS
ncbi:G kinase-anchoring protein 1-like [Corticium candelabrum]|uniref:G kinase-anchoring protein 1-like n=1 Tax=Corticium candelabrum TaxID=121492 RepID=UPI002E257402|nr:G kinase-anchoring protein 1-like [Corticium candelabrum]